MAAALASPHIETFWTPELARGYPTSQKRQTQTPVLDEPKMRIDLSTSYRGGWLKFQNVVILSIGADCKQEVETKYRQMKK